ncbi:MAG: type II toxin-antitoxin system PemK/MazF family toxin [Armatimonadetes bacterium]|nr:type II toxin-antitoxin system PemK/MazF family toxin [Armatimonadota bacterium]
MNSTIRRGEVVRVRLDPVEGSEQAGERPALVISPDLINEHSPVIIVAAVTSKKTERIYPFEALIELPDGGISTRSKVSLMQIRSIDKRRVIGRYGRVGRDTMQSVEEALRIATGMRPL